MASFTFDPSTDAGAVRMALADIEEETSVFDDAMISAFLTRGGSVDGAIYLGAMARAAQAGRGTSARSESDQGGSMQIDDSHQAEHWLALASRYAHAKPGRRAGVISDGGRPWDHRRSR